MTIVSVNIHYSDELGYQDYYLCKEFLKMGHKVIQIASDRHFQYPDYESTVQPIIGPRMIGVGVFKSKLGIDIYRLPAGIIILNKIRMNGLKKKLAELQPDLVICHGIFNAYAYRIAQYAMKYKVPVIYDDHTTSNFKNNSLHVKAISKIFRKLATPIIEKTAKKIVAISDSVKPYLEHDLGFKKNVVIIPLGADTDIFFPDETERVAIRQQLGVSDTTLLITYTGKIYKDKLVEQIPAALKMIDLVNKKVAILFVGPLSAQYKQHFDEMLADKSIEMIYHHSVPPPELRKYYNASDICCWPAHATGSTVEASACGKPIICNQMMSERYSNGNGFGIEPGNTVQLKEVLEKLIFDNELRKKMGEAGIEYIEKELSWNAIAKKFLS